MPLVTQAHRQLRRTQILKAAFSCFSRGGIHRTSIEDICRESKLSPGAIYTYFASKEDILNALADLARASNARLLNAVVGPPGAGSGALKIFELMKRLRGPESAAGFQLDVRLWAEALDNPSILAVGRTAREETTALLQSALATRPGSHVESHNSRAVALLLLLVLAGFEVHKALDPEWDVSPALDLLARWIAPESSSP